MYSSDGGFDGRMVRRKSTYADGASMSTRKYARVNENSVDSRSVVKIAVSRYRCPFALRRIGTAIGVMRVPLMIRPTM